MIDEKRLLCAFIYSAYESGYCGLALNPDPKKSAEISEQHKALYLSYLENEQNYPEQEIASTQQKMSDSIKHSGVRDYIYRGHFEVVVERIKEETGIEFTGIKHSSMALFPAKFCPINYYQVLEVENNKMKGKNLISNKTTNLKLLRGLERPNIGNVVSSHWGFMLEVVSDWNDFNKYFQFAENYYKSLLA
jgi:hypothetical protein